MLQSRCRVGFRELMGPRTFTSGKESCNWTSATSAALGRLLSRAISFILATYSAAGPCAGCAASTAG